MCRACSDVSQLHLHDRLGVKATGRHVGFKSPTVAVGNAIGLGGQALVPERGRPAVARLSLSWR
jgi:hypothetical protein